MKMSFLNKVVGMASAAACVVKKNSPTLLVVGGVAAAIASGVGLVIATTKLSPVVEEAKESLNTIHKCAEDPEHEEDYTEEDVKRDTTIVYARAAKEAIKLYSIPVSLGVLSIVSFLSSYGILKRRNAAVTAAYVALDEGYKQYKARIVSRLGEDVERRIRYGLKVEEIEEEITDENGEKKTVKRTVEVPDDSDPSVVITNEGVFTVTNDTTPSRFARYFDPSSRFFENDPEYNKKLIMDTEEYFNKILPYKKHIWMNEIYTKLDLKTSRDGQTHGFKYDPKGGDHQISFGIFDVYKPDNRDFVNGYTPVVLLDFPGVRLIIDEVFPPKDAKYVDDGTVVSRIPLTR